MGAKTASGFTIIEVMLFLAVTGALAAGVLVGSGVSIGQQRYKDSVHSLKSLIQSQYSEVDNVVNARGHEASCNKTNAIVTESSEPGVVSQQRGTGDCLLLGRLITVESGTDITISNVVGVRSAGEPAESDVAELGAYTLRTSPIDQEEGKVEWSTRIVSPGSADAQPLSLLIVRSPLSGSILTFASTIAPAPSLSSLVSGLDSRSRGVDLCVEGAAGTFVGSQMAVRINPYATSPSAIEIPAESDGVCD